VYEYPDSGEQQVEVHFSSGVDKNMFGIDRGHNAQYAAVGPMIRIHNCLGAAELDTIVGYAEGAYSERAAVLPQLAAKYYRECASRDAALIQQGTSAGIRR